jgi:hypothetical protein
VTNAGRSGFFGAVEGTVTANMVDHRDGKAHRQSPELREKPQSNLTQQLRQGPRWQNKEHYCHTFCQLGFERIACLQAFKEQ